MIFQVHIVSGDDKTYITFNILQLFLKTLLPFIILLVKLFEKYHKRGSQKWLGFNSSTAFELLDVLSHLFCLPDSQVLQLLE